MLKELREGWNEAARTDPLYHILTEQDKEGGGWDVEEFFERGRSDVMCLMRNLRGTEFDPKRGKALDFGCGVGRCTQALADYFESVCGVDISAQMLRLARRFDRSGRCVFRVNAATLGFDDSTFDFIYSQFVFQHMPENLQLGYMEEFVRILKPGGIASFVLAEGSSADSGRPWRAMYGLADSEGSIRSIFGPNITRVPTDAGEFWTVKT